MTETNRTMRSHNLLTLLFAISGTLILLSSAFINPVYHFASAVLLMLAAAILYFLIVFTAANRNWLDIRAVFTLVWLFTIGLANLRLTEYQEEWQNKTWIILALAYGVFHIGAALGIKFVEARQRKWADRTSLKASRVFFYVRRNRLFSVSMFVTLVGLLAFSANIYVKGFLPAFSSDQHAYINFYTKFHVFSVAATTVSGLCYFTIKTQSIAKWKKVLLYLSIIYLTIVFPVLVVSRGVFILSSISLLVSVFYLNKKRLWVLVCCVFIIGCVYVLISSLRNLSDWQLNYYFEPAEIAITKEQPITADDYEETTSDAYEETTSDAYRFKLSPKMAFLYGYLTVSHDNFNEAVQNSIKLSYGIRQFRPFNVILRLPLPEIEKTYLVRDHLNTHNLIGDAYYDFHEVGVAVSVFIWAFIFGAIQAWYMAYKGPFALMALGNAVTATTLSFFAPWVSDFTFWMFWGVALLLFLACSTGLRARETDQK